MGSYMVMFAVIIGIIGVLTLFSLLYFVSARNSKIYKSFKEPVKTEATVVDIKAVTNSYADESYSDYYIITYSYLDEYGYEHTAGFKFLQKPFEKGDKITVHYDLRDPENSISDIQLKTSSSMWWKILLILAAIIIPVVLIIKWSMR